MANNIFPLHSKHRISQIGTEYEQSWRMLPNCDLCLAKLPEGVLTDKMKGESSSGDEAVNTLVSYKSDFLYHDYPANPGLSTSAPHVSQKRCVSRNTAIGTNPLVSFTVQSAIGCASTRNNFYATVLFDSNTSNEHRDYARTCRTCANPSPRP